MVSDLVSLYGHWYGRKMMQGSLRAQLGIIFGAISQRRVSVALGTVAPDAYEARTRDLLERTDPVPYVLPYFGTSIKMKTLDNIMATHMPLWLIAARD